MKFLEIINKMEQLDQLIRLKCINNPVELSKKLEISESSFYEMLNLMRELGAEIKYDRFKKSYFYTKPYKFHIGFKKIDLNYNSK